MMFWRVAFWVIFGATGVVYGVMLLDTLPTISEGAAGLLPFDLRPMGYTTAEAQAFVDHLTVEARATYLGKQHLLDSVFPALLCLSMFGAFSMLVSHRGLRWGLIALAFGAALADYTENARVARMLSEDGMLTADLVSAASLATVTKSILNTIAMVALLVAVGAAVFSKRKTR